ncbi:hypothetical protein L4D77_16595 [Photobacterium frigidiphilum]|uniref:hypothetical protein n=1 Tax=Photobacterium frigidiphilum TaxID=264736 RepID=UPI003D132D6F
MMYIHRVSTLNIKQNETFDIKAECKKVASAYIRRTDRFIQLGLLGVSGLLKVSSGINLGDIDKNTAVFMVSGQGNLAVFSRLCHQRYVEEVPPKPVDFINSLSNTAGFYIAKYLGLESKNLNLAQQGFVVENALLLADANLRTGQETHVLLGGIDEKPEDKTLPHSYLNLPINQAIGEGSNWILLSAKQQDALASIEVSSQEFDSTTIVEYIKNQSGITHVVFGQRMPQNMCEQLRTQINIPLFDCFDHYDFYETNILFVLNRYIEKEQGCLAYIDYFNNVYRVILVTNTIILDTSI